MFFDTANDKARTGRKNEGKQGNLEFYKPALS